MTDPDAPTAATSTVKVLSVVGAGRSGTTVLASILGEVDGIASAGELRWLWSRGVLERRPCGCGEAPEACPVWAPVIARSAATSVPGWSASTTEQIVAAQHEVGRRDNQLRVLRSVHRRQTDWPALQQVRAVIGSALVAFAEVTAARVVVDTSKRPQDAAVLAGLAGVDHYVLHMVRDPRAVVHSWTRAKTFSTGAETRVMGTRSLPSSVRRWLGNSLGAEVLRRQLPHSRWLQLRYEDFARGPRESVDEILQFLEQSGPTPFVQPDTVALGPNHIVAGNPSRFTTGTVQIRSDDAWRQQMARPHQLLVEVATKPLMRRYGFTHAGRTSTDA